MKNWNIIKKIIDTKKFKIKFASLPTPYIYKNNLIIFYSPRDKKNKSYVAYSEFDKKFNLIKKNKILVKKNIFNKYFSDGIMPSCFLKSLKGFIFYFCGWSKIKNYPFHQEIIYSKMNEKNIKLEKRFYKINLKKNNPLYVTNPFIIKVKKRYLMFYLSALKWMKNNNKKISKYGIKIAKSNNLKKWSTSKKYLFPLDEFSEIAQARPVVFFYKKFYWLFYSSRKSRFDYRIKFSKSKDCLKWSRPQFCRFRNSSLWCNQMKAYPYVFKFNKKIYMLFCGNQYGKNGIGLAKLIV